MSRMGVLSRRSAPMTWRMGPPVLLYSIWSSFTEESPIGLGRNGLRVAKTPTRLFPPSRGGLTVGLQVSRSAWLNTHISQIYSKFSSSRTASATLYSGSKMIRALEATMPACRGMPNFVGKGDSICAICFIFEASGYQVRYEFRGCASAGGC